MIAVVSRFVFVSLFSCLTALADSYVFTAVHIVDVDAGRVIRDGAIVVEDGRISYAGPAGDAPLPAGATRIDAAGQWAIPGLWDMHVHLESATEKALPVLVANGVTHVRDMGANWDRIQEMRQRVRDGDDVGPRIVACGPFLESARWVDRAKGFLSEKGLRARVGIAEPDEVPAVLDRLVEQGVDFVKFRTMQSKDVYFALADGCRERGLPLTGHAPPGAVSLTDAAEAGQASIEHYVDGPGIRNLPEDRDEAYAVFKKHRTHFVPTMISGHGFRVKPTEDVLAVINDESNILDARRQYIPENLLESWREQMEMKGSERFSWDYPQIHADNLKLFGEMHAAGVSLMVGTDLGGPNVFPGFSVHEELRIFVDEMGLSEMDALRAATIVPARFMGKGDEFGAIRAGLAADFVLLAGDPLDDIGNVAGISGVMHRGRWFDEEALDALLASGASG